MTEQERFDALLEAMLTKPGPDDAGSDADVDDDDGDD